MHCAGLKAVGESCQKPLAYYKNNVEGTISLLEVCYVSVSFGVAMEAEAIPDSIMKNNICNIIECYNNTHQGRHIQANKRALALRTSVTVVTLLVQ